jgi:hypothetical protein
MTFLYGTNMELLYSLPAVGPTQTSSVATCLNTAASAAPFQLPALQNIWSLSQIAGKGLMVVAAGGYDDASANTLTTLRLSLDTASGTTSTNIMAEAGFSNFTGAATWAWEAQVWLTCTGAIAGTASTWYANGQLTIGPGNNPTGTALTLMWGQPAIAAGIPTAVTLPTQVAYFTNIVSQFQASPTAMVCTQFMVFGLN